MPAPQGSQQKIEGSKTDKRYRDAYFKRNYTKGQDEEEQHGPNNREHNAPATIALAPRSRFFANWFIHQARHTSAPNPGPNGKDPLLDTCCQRQDLPTPPWRRRKTLNNGVFYQMDARWEKNEGVRGMDAVALRQIHVVRKTPPINQHALSQ